MKKNLNKLSLTELKTLHDLLNEGFIDGYSSKYIAIEAEGSQHGHEIWKERMKIREEQLQRIRDTISNKASEIDF